MATSATIRTERPMDASTIRALLIEAFEGTGEADLVERLRADGDSVIALVAEKAGAVVGHVLLSRMRAPFPALGLAPLAVRAGHRRGGIAGRLIGAALELAAQGPWRCVFVLGEPAFYRRFGFDAKLARGFASPHAGPCLMALPLGGPLPARSGTIAYAPAFGALG